MIEDRLVEAKFFIPLCRDRFLSDGQPHDAEAWNWLTDSLWREFAGASWPETYFMGFYPDADTGERVDDRSRGYLVALNTSRTPTLRSLLQQACRVFGQKSIYLSVAGYVEFVTSNAVLDEPGNQHAATEPVP